MTGNDTAPASAAARIPLDNPFPGAASYYIDATTSTMDEARRLSASAPRGLVQAGVQSAGRGRLPDRNWHAEAGRSLLVTFWFPSGEFGGAPLPLVAGIALVRACLSWADARRARFNSELCLKWPNDVLCGGRKIAGVLCESAGGIAYAGIGLNCSQSAFPPGFRTPPGSIYLATGVLPDARELLSRLVGSLYRLRGGDPGWKDDYEALLSWRGQPVRFTPGIGSEPVEGILRGIDGTGAVVLERRVDGQAELAAWPSGELSPL